MVYKVHIDFETRSEVDLKKVGAWKYSTHPTTKILCLAYQDTRYYEKSLRLVKILDWDMLYDPNWEQDPMWSHTTDELTELRAYVEHPETIFFAHNSFFEFCIWHNIMHKRLDWPVIKPNQWNCSAAQAAAMALPRSLEDCSTALLLDSRKDKTGKNIMMQLSKPRRPSKDNSDLFFEKDKYPDKFQTLYNYCAQDVRVELEISKTLPALTPKEKQIWQLDQMINRRGVQIDVDAVEMAIKTAEKFNQELTEELVELTKGEITSARQSVKLKNYLNEKWYVDISDVQRGTLENLLKNCNCVDDEELKRIIEIRLQLSKSSIAKYEAIKNAVCGDGRVRDLLVFHGATTGRWAGKNIQVHNLPRGTEKDPDTCIDIFCLDDYEFFKDIYPNVNDALSSCIRGMIIPEPGYKFLIADFSSIEARVLAWLAQELKLVRAFDAGKDAYIQMASVIYNKKPEDITKDERQLGKQAVLGCGYGMGVNKFHETCKSYGMDISEDLAELAVTAYRNTFSEIPVFWKKVNSAAMKAVSSPIQMSKINWQVEKHGIDFLTAQLPSGRKIAYPDPSVKMVSKKFKNDVYENETLCFKGVDTYTRKWSEQNTYGGKLTENLVQAISRDILAEAMLRCENAGYRIVLTVHDEIVAEVPSEFGSVEEFVSLMETRPTWAKDCPISAEGFETQRYRK